jgi:predicted nucleic acid-binding protein
MRIVLDTNVLLVSISDRSPYFRFDLIKKDRDDNKFVDCAIAANAHYIVSEDKDFRVLKKIDFPKVEVLSLEKFRKKLEKEGEA